MGEGKEMYFEYWKRWTGPRIIITLYYPIYRLLSYVDTLQLITAEE